MAKHKFEKAKNGNWVCPHCGSSDTFENGHFAFTTDFTQLFPFWCSNCNMPFHIEKRNGKVVERDEF